MQIWGSWLIAIGGALLALGLMQELQNRECLRKREFIHEHDNLRQPC
jgi:hypothetical protein